MVNILGCRVSVVRRINIIYSPLPPANYYPQVLQFFLHFIPIIAAPEGRPVFVPFPLYFSNSVKNTGYSASSSLLFSY